MSGELDHLFAEIAREGWRVNNLYQSLDTGLWRVCLFSQAEGGANHGDWGEGDTLADALEEAIGKMAEAEFVREPEVTFALALAAEPRTNLLASLGLRSRPTITRRV